jgi:polygalacturonase
MQSSVFRRSNRFYIKAVASALAAGFFAVILHAQEADSVRKGDGWEQLPAILKGIVQPTFPQKDFPVTTFGAKGDGKTDCTKAFRKAIDACARSGGGRVVVPAGDFLSGAIHLKSNVNLHLAKGAVIRFSTNPKKYLPVVFTRWEGIECYNYSAFIYAFEQTNIAVTGSGILDGQADSSAWWPWTGNARFGHKSGDLSQTQDRPLLLTLAEKGVPVKDRVFGKGHRLRPNFIQPYRCKNVLIEGVTIKNSPMWEIHPVLCTNVTVRSVQIASHGPNNDGCDPESCDGVLIENCTFDTGDDCIAIKSGRNADGRRVNVPSQNIVVRGCTMKEGHGGVVIGSEVSGGARNVFAENCAMDSPNLDRALRIKTNSVRGGIVENIFMRNVTVGQVAEAVILTDFFYEEGDSGSHTPTVRHIRVNNVRSGQSRYGVYLRGYERSPISDIVLEDCEFNDVKQGNVISHVSGLVMKRVLINGRLQP